MSLVCVDCGADLRYDTLHKSQGKLLCHGCYTRSLASLSKDGIS